MTRGPSTGRLDRAEPLAEPTRDGKGDVMRRMWAAGAAIVMSLVLGGLPAAGQEASDEPSTAPDTATASATIAMTTPITVTNSNRVAGWCAVAPATGR